MPHDLIIRNGTVVDGTGAAPRTADVAISGGRITAIGGRAAIVGNAARVIDAAGLIVTPGFIDPHTHYDAQICWDPLISCSSWHGVTSVIMGNCGVGLAPCKPAERDIAAWNLVHVEAIPFDVLQQGLTWDWETFPQYMDAADRRGLGINAGFFAALSPFRHWVMGEDAMERAASEEETGRIRGLLREAIGAGAFGFSLTVMPQHLGYKGQPLACRLASNDELRAYAGILHEYGRGVIEIALTRQPSTVSDKEYALLDLLSGASGRPVTWLNLRDRDDAAERLARNPREGRAAAASADVFRKWPHVRLIIEFNLRNPFLFASMNAMKPVFADKAVRSAEAGLCRRGFPPRLR